MRLHSIRARTLLVFALICVAIVSIMGGIWLYVAGQNIKSNVNTIDLHDSRVLAGYVREYVGSVENTARTISVDPDAATALRTGDATKIRPDIDGMVNATSQDDVAFLIDADGRLIYCTAAAPSDPFIGDYVRGNKNSTYITGMFYSNVSRDHVFAVVSPICGNGSTLGYFCDEVKPGDIGAFFKNNKLASVDHAILVDGGGRVISRSNLSAAEEHANLSSHPPVRLALAGEEGIVEYVDPADNLHYISAYAPVSDTGWGIIVSTRADTAYRPLQVHAYRILGLCALFIAALMVFGYFTSTYLIDPVERLLKTMRKVSAGDYDVRIEARRKDEIGDLERSFNALVAELKKRDEGIRAERDRSEFYLDLMGHDINNMNHAGMGYLELAAEDLKGRIDGQDMALIEKARGALESSSALIDSVRKIKKVRASLPAQEELDLGRLLAWIKEKYSRYPGRAISIRYSPVSCRVRAGALFGEALSNIVENAIKHSDPARPLEIAMGLSRITEGGKDYCRVGIEDNGPGIPDGMKEAIFTRSYRGPTGTHGKGLGLYIVKMLVEEYGGRVWTEDRVPGDYTRGARFVILMPAVKNAGTQ